MKQAPVYRSSRYNRSTPNVKRRGFRLKKTFLSLLILVLVGGAVYYALHATAQAKPVAKTTTTTQTSTTTSTTKTTATTAAPNACASNTLSQLILVSISQRHMWACNGSSVSYDSAVVTGMEFLPADLTPTGTYHIFTKETDHTLTGCDSTGCWNDYVSYYLIFLTNQYGNYGFHDATWRAPSDFGNISPNSPNASHGCVELPLATAKWLYSWAPIGTTVTIQS